MRGDVRGARTALRGWVREGVAAAAIAVAAACAIAPPAANAKLRTVEYRSSAIRIGSYQTINTARWVRAPRMNGYLRSMHAVVVDAKGRRVSQTRVMLHHAVFLNYGRRRGDRRSTYCSGRDREPFYGTAEEDQPLRLPEGYGYRLRRADRWRLRFMVMNHRERIARVYIRYRLVVDTARNTPVTPHWVSVSCNRDRMYNVAGGGAPGSLDRRSVDWTVPRTGRIVAIAAHLHGGGRRVAVTQPACGDRTLAAPSARYGLPDDPIYRVSPVLHEPSPRSVSVAASLTGWQVSAGDVLRVTSEYDGEQPHVKVMGIAHLYVAEGDSPPLAACPALPGDVQAIRRVFRGRPGLIDPPPVRVELSRRGARGLALPLASLSGRTTSSPGDATVQVRDFAFSPRRLSVPAGATVHWAFRDRVAHDVTLANGPRGVASTYKRRGATFSQTFTEPGTYQLFCSLHPVDMPEVIEVRPAASG